MSTIRKASVTFTKTGDLSCSSRGFRVGDDWGYANFWIVNTCCHLDAEAISTILQFCEEGEKGEAITVTPCDDRPEFTIEHNGDEQLTLTFLGVEAVYQCWAYDLAEVAKDMAIQAKVATEEAKRRKSGCTHHVGYKCNCQILKGC